MNVNISGKNMQIGESLSERITGQISSLLEKYFAGRGDASVVLSKEASGFQCDIKINLPNRVVLHSQSKSHGDPTAVYLESEEKISKQLRRYKRRLNSITREEISHEDATEYTLQSFEEAEEDPQESPLVIAEQNQSIQTLTVSDAVMRMDLGDLDYLLFRNGGNKRLNLVYRRPDGHYGWVDPKQQ